VVADGWQRLRTHRWAGAAQRALAPIGTGLMAAGVYTLARSALHDAVTVALALATALILTQRWALPTVVIVAAGLVGWLLGV
jgi:chromate transport protein ChrA